MKTNLIVDTARLVQPEKLQQALRTMNSSAEQETTYNRYEIPLNIKIPKLDYEIALTWKI